MVFEQRKFYTHKNMLDMTILVMYVFLPFDNCTKLKVKWFNKRGMDIGVEETVKIMNKDFDNWYEWKGI